MAYRIMKQIQTQLNVPGDTTTHVIVYMECDTLADLPASPTAISGLTLEISSRAHIIQDNTRYCMQADGTWQQQDQSPYSDVYTKSQVDSIVSDIDSTIVIESGRITAVEGDVSDIQTALEGILNRTGKNIANWTAATQTITDVTFTIDQAAGTVSTSGTAGARRQKPLPMTLLSDPGSDRYILTGCPAGGEVGGNIKYALYIWDNTINARVSQNDTGEGIIFDWTPDPTHSYNISVDIRSGTDAAGLIFRPMICRLSDYLISSSFVPYVPSNSDIIALIHSYHP